MTIEKFVNQKVSEKYVKIIAGVLTSIPILYYFTIFFTYQVNAPHEDDYDTVLIFMNELVQMDNLWEKIWWSATHMSNEHIIFLNHIVSWGQYQLLGEIDFRLLTTFGSLIVLITWVFFIRTSDNLLDKKSNVGALLSGIFLVVSSLLFFNLSFFDSTFRATSLMQKIGVVLIGFLTMKFFQEKKIVSAFFLSISGILINGNGLFIPISVLILCVIHKDKRNIQNILIWTITSLTVILFYNHIATLSPRSYNYVDPLSFSSLLKMLHHYFSFCGSAFEPFGHFLALFGGIVMNLVFLLLLFRKNDSKYFEICGTIIFLMLSFLATSYGRGEEGYTQAFSPRYKLYSAVFFLLNFLLYLLVLKERRVVFGVAMMIVLTFTVFKYHSQNFKEVVSRKKELKFSINNFSFSSEDTIKLHYTPNQTLPRETLRTSSVLGIYTNDHIDQLLKKE